MIAGTNRGFETIRFGINDSTGIENNKYELLNRGGMRVTYKNSTITDDYYRTQNFNPGSLSITEIDKANKTIRGSFHFVAYHSFRPNEGVIITDGSFHVKYTTY